MQQDERGHGSNGRGSRWVLFTVTKETSGHGHWVWGLGGRIRQPPSSSLFIPSHWDSWTLGIPQKKPCVIEPRFQGLTTQTPSCIEKTILSEPNIFTSKLWDIFWLHRKQWAGGMEWDRPRWKKARKLLDVSLHDMVLREQADSERCLWMSHRGRNGSLWDQIRAGAGYGQAVIKRR